ncbi:MAG: hypothetical protein WCA48_22945 [Pseudomonas gingeri]
MNINSPISTYSYTPSTVNKNVQSQASKTSATDVTNLADVSTAATQTSPATTTQDSKVKSAFVQDLPDEAYAIPAWRAGYYEDITSTLVTGLPGNYVNPKNSGFSAASQADNTEYGELLQKHVKETYEKNGLMNAGDRYKALSVNKDLDEHLHKEFTASVSSDPRMMELMSKLGVVLT